MQKILGKQATANAMQFNADMMGAFMGAAVAAGGGVAKLHAALLCFVN